MRTIIVAGLLVIALLGAVLASIGSGGPIWLWACDPGMWLARPLT